MPQALCFFWEGATSGTGTSDYDKETKSQILDVQKLKKYTILERPKVLFFFVLFWIWKVAEKNQSWQ